MARPQKQTVDYFPHFCVPKKTLFILEQKYGNDGYAFWFKLLEMLGSTSGHFLVLKSDLDWEFLTARTRLDREKCAEILDLLASLDSIDKPLWADKKIVWSENFIDNVKDVYRYRTINIPSKPFSEKKNDKKVVSSGSSKKKSKVKEPKLKFGDSVRLTKTEYDNLVEKFGECAVLDKITKMDNYKGATGRKYASDYRALLNWFSNDSEANKMGGFKKYRRV